MTSGLFSYQMTMSHKIIIFITALFLALSVSGCAIGKSFVLREDLADAIARDRGLAKNYIKSGRFTLVSYSRFNAPARALRVYIEGDGKAWKSRRRLSHDPTPSNPLALRLAAVDESANVAYLARPGQYQPSNAESCDSTYWSARRFAPEVIDAVNGAIDKLKINSGAGNIELVGYSGGGAIAVLVAARRKDVVSLRTVAGNLDHIAVSNYHNVSRLKGSLNPIDTAPIISKLPQRHFIGGDDKRIPAHIVESFVEKTGDRPHTRITNVKGAAHGSGWAEKWPELLLLPPS